MFKLLCAATLTIVIALPLIAGQPETKAGEAPKVKVTLVVILASEEAGEIDARLKQVAEEIQKHHPQFKSFKLKSMASRSLGEKEKANFALVEMKSVDIVVKQKADKDNRVELAVTPPEQGEIVYRSTCGKFLPIVTRHQTKERERLILAIRVQPCNGE